MGHLDNLQLPCRFHRPTARPQRLWFFIEESADQALLPASLRCVVRAAAGKSRAVPHNHVRCATVLSGSLADRLGDHVQQRGDINRFVQHSPGPRVECPTHAVVSGKRRNHDGP